MARRRDSLAARVLPPLLGLTTLAALLGAWQGLADAGAINRFVAPAPSDIALAFPSLFTEEDGLSALGRSFGCCFAAAAIAGLVGIAIGWWLHRNRLAGYAFENWVANIAAAPLVLLYPLFLVLFGRNDVTITAVPPVILKTKEGLDGVRRTLINVGRSLRLTERHLFRKILLPAAARVIMTGIRLGLILALISVVGIEYLIHLDGLGSMIADFGDRFEIPQMFAAICFVLLTSVAFYAFGEGLEKWLSRA